MQNTPAIAGAEVWAPGPIWSGQGVVIIGAGPSLTAEQVAVVRESGSRVIVINTSWTLAEWADILYAADSKWWDWNAGARAFRGLRVTTSPEASAKYGLHYIRGRQGAGLSADPALIHWGPARAQHSGQQAINLAVHLGVTSIALLGYDLHEGQDGTGHWHGLHPDRTLPNYRLWRAAYIDIARDAQLLNVSITNCSPGTAIQAFPKSHIEDYLEVSRLPCTQS